MRARTILLGLVVIVFILLFIPLLIFFFIIRQREPLLIVGRSGVKLGLKILGLGLEVQGKEKVAREEAHIFMANHLSLIDGPLLFLLIPQPVRVILKKEVFRIPVIGVGMRYVEFVSVDRKRMKAGKASIAKAVNLMKSRGYSFLIFPEGTRSRDGRIQVFKRGGFFLALESGAAIVPISISGTYEIMPRGSFFIKKGKIRVVFHPAIPVAGYEAADLPDLMTKVKETILSGLENR
jgi:1-acyl-sn-glycerol-3-phosphate acyltransferase